MKLIDLDEFMPDQSDGLLGERFESLALRERPATIVAFFKQFAGHRANRMDDHAPTLP